VLLLLFGGLLISLTKRLLEASKMSLLQQALPISKYGSWVQHMILQFTVKMLEKVIYIISLTIFFSFIVYEKKERYGIY
jgi:hypothetical protein